VLHYPLVPLFRSSIKEATLGMLLGRRSSPAPKFIEALRSLSLRVDRGERVGLIGRNGAGKSSLLRTIAGIYPPTSGSVRVHGQIRSLFELFLGFEPEDNGRQNIRYRGYLLGYSKQEIAKLEDEIIDFAGLRESIDLPLKTYSAGMNVRLAFSISTAIGGDIVLIDEVFAAGDAEFQARAQRRMREIIQGSACMIFVSHDLQAIRENCTRVVWLDNGAIVADGEPEQILQSYTENLS